MYMAAGFLLKFLQKSTFLVVLFVLMNRYFLCMRRKRKFGNLLIQEFVQKYYLILNSGTLFLIYTAAWVLFAHTENEGGITVIEEADVYKI
jgi:hypothetical protein